MRYEREHPGELIHIDVKKLGRIPDGGGWRIHGRTAQARTHRLVGFDYVHAAIDDHSRLAYAEIHPDETGATCAGFLVRAAAFFAECGITRIERVMTDNAFGYRLSHDFQAALARLGARHVLIRPHCPWQNGKVERLNRTLQREWAYPRPFLSNDSGPRRCQNGSSTTTPDAATRRSGAERRSAGCHQCGEWVHLAAAAVFVLGLVVMAGLDAANAATTAGRRAAAGSPAGPAGARRAALAAQSSSSWTSIRSK